MVKRLKSTLLLSALLLSYLLFSYYYFGGWWNSSVGSVLILLFSYLLWEKNFLKNTGLLLSLKAVVKSLILTGVIIICALLLMKYIAEKQDIRIEYTGWRNYFHDIFYILNEEIVLGAILLFTLVRKYKLKPLTASLVLAVAFAIIHFVFYQWIFDQRGTISITALLTLFLVGFVRNGLILRTGHIAYSWALHFGWMVIMFGNMHTFSRSGLQLTEPERFNLYLGSTEMLILSFIISGSCFIYCFKKLDTNSFKMPR